MGAHSTIPVILTVDVVQLTGGDDPDVGHEKVGQGGHWRYGALPPVAQDVAVGRDKRMVGLAPQHVDRAAGFITHRQCDRRTAALPSDRWSAYLPHPCKAPAGADRFRCHLNQQEQSISLPAQSLRNPTSCAQISAPLRAAATMHQLRGLAVLRSEISQDGSHDCRIGLNCAAYGSLYCFGCFRALHLTAIFLRFRRRLPLPTTISTFEETVLRRVHELRHRRSPDQR